MKTIAVVTMNTESRPASRGSRGELEPGCLRFSSPTLSSDGTSLCVGPAGPRPEAEEVRGSPVLVCCVDAVVSDSDCLWMVEVWAVELLSCTVWAGRDEKVVRGSVVSGALPSVVVWMGCGGVELCAPGVDERLSVGAEAVAAAGLALVTTGISVCGDVATVTLAV